MTGTGAGRAWRVVVAFALVTGGAAVPVGSTAAASGRVDDHVLLAVTAGPAGARQFATAVTVRIADARTGPRLSLFGLGTARGGLITAAEGGGGPLRLSTTRGAGGISAELAGPVRPLAPQPVTMRLRAARLAPGETVVALEAFGNFQVSHVQLARYSLGSGSVRVRLVKAPGTVVVPVGDPSDDMVAADAGLVGVGTQERRITSPTDIGGAFVYAPAGVAASSWLAPDRNTGRWTSGEGAAVGWPSFAGPSGRWQLNWTGVDTAAAGNPVAYAYTPLAGYWRSFRCRTGCTFPASPVRVTSGAPVRETPSTPSERGSRRRSR